MIIEIAKQNDIKSLAEYDKHIPLSRLEAAANEGFVYVLKNDEALIVGVLRYSLFWQTIPFLDLIYIDEKYQNQGFGTAMMSLWESDMKAQGYGSIMASTQSDETAWKFYEKLGFRKVGSFLPPDQEADELIYLKMKAE